MCGSTTLHVTPNAIPSNHKSPPPPWDLLAHSRQSLITKITVNGHPTTYSYTDHLSGILHRTREGRHGPVSLTKLRGQPLVPSANARDLGTFHHTLSHAMDQADRGEVSIDMSRAHKQSTQTTVVTIEFVLKEPETGLHFSGADETKVDAHGWACPTHAYTFRHPLAAGSVLGNGDGARCCFPCIDTLSDRCPWSIAIKVEKGMKVFATGMLMDKDVKSSTKEDEFVFHTHERVPAHVIGFAIGRFRQSGSGVVPLDATHAPHTKGQGGRSSMPRLKVWVLSDALVDEDEGTSMGPEYQHYHDLYSTIVDRERGDDASTREEEGRSGSAGRKAAAARAARQEVDRTVANTMAALWPAIDFVRKWLSGGGGGSGGSGGGGGGRGRGGSSPTRNTSAGSSPSAAPVSVPVVGVDHPNGPTLPFHNRLTVVYVQGAPIHSVFFGAGLTIVGEDASADCGGLQTEIIPGTFFQNPFLFLPEIYLTHFCSLVLLCF